MRKWVRGAVLVGLIGVAREDILLHDDVKGEVPLHQDQIRNIVLEKQDDPYIAEARNVCHYETSTPLDCIKYGLLERFETFLSKDHKLGDHALLAKSPRRINLEQAEGRSLPGLAGYLARKAWEYAAGTDLVLEFPKALTEREEMSPRFIDEVFSEFDTIDNKNEKPQIRNQLKKLFIPLLIILKIFKLKLLFLLPLILGVASFKKIIGFLALLIPGVIGYLKLCRSGLDYGAHGHSSYYNRPPHRRQDHEYDVNGESSSYEPYSPEFANIHPDYLPDYLQESASTTKSTYQKESSAPSSIPNHQYYSKDTASVQNHQNYYPQNDYSQSPQNYHTQRDDFWTAQKDYLPYKGYYREHALKT